MGPDAEKMPWKTVGSHDLGRWRGVTIAVLQGEELVR